MDVNTHILKQELEQICASYFNTFASASGLICILHNPTTESLYIMNTATEKHYLKTVVGNKYTILSVDFWTQK